MAELEAAQPAPPPSNSTIPPAFTPMRFLPTDVVYCIYLACHHHDPRHFATIASHVCKSWRELALGAATLWTDLVFDRSRYTVEKNVAWALRSGECLLNVDIQSKAFKKASVATARGVLRLLKSERHRIQTLKVDDDIPMKIRRMLFDGLRDVAVPQLRELRVQVDDDGESRGWKLRLFEAPTLERLAIRRREFDWSSPLIATLKAFKITSVPDFIPSVAHDIFTRAQRLESFNLLLSDRLDPSWDTAAIDIVAPTPIVHHALSYLHVPPKILKYLQQAFHFPALRHLRISDFYYHQPPLGSSPPLDDVFPGLQRLTIHIWTGGDSEALETKLNDYLIGFANIKTIKTVVFDSIYWTDEDGEGSIIGRFGQKIPSCVDTVIVEEEHDGHGNLGNDYTVVKAFVESRMKAEGIVPIRHLELKLPYDSPENAEVLEWLKSNVDEFFMGPPESEESKPFWGDF